MKLLVIAGTAPPTRSPPPCAAISPLAVLAATAALSVAPAAHAGPLSGVDEVSPMFRAPFGPTFVRAAEGTKDRRIRLNTTCHADLCRYRLETMNGSATSQSRDYRRYRRTARASDGGRVALTVPVVVFADDVDERDETFRVRLTETITNGTKTTTGTLWATVLIPGNIIDRVSACAACVALPPQQPAVTPPIPDPGPQVADVAPTTIDPAPVTDPAPETPADPSTVLRPDHLTTGITIAETTPAVPVIR